MIGCLTETTTCVVAKPLVTITLELKISIDMPLGDEAKSIAL